MRNIIERWGNADDGNPDTLLFKFVTGNESAYEIKQLVCKVTQRCNIILARISKVLGYETYQDKELIDQKLLAKMAGVTRQTVARWEQMGFISRSDVGLSRDKYFQIKEVISQLEKLKE
jgi:hypothetical protein